MSHTSETSPSSETSQVSQTSVQVSYLPCIHTLNVSIFVMSVFHRDEKTLKIHSPPHLLRLLTFSSSVVLHFQCLTLFFLIIFLYINVFHPISHPPFFCLSYYTVFLHLPPPTERAV